MRDLRTRFNLSSTQRSPALAKSKRFAVLAPTEQLLSNALDALRAVQGPYTSPAPLRILAACFVGQNIDRVGDVGTIPVDLWALIVGGALCNIPPTPPLGFMRRSRSLTVYQHVQRVALYQPALAGRLEAAMVAAAAAR